MLESLKPVMGGGGQEIRDREPERVRDPEPLDLVQVTSQLGTSISPSMKMKTKLKDLRPLSVFTSQVLGNQQNKKKFRHNQGTINSPLS